MCLSSSLYLHYLFFTSEWIKRSDCTVSNLCRSLFLCAVFLLSLLSNSVLWLSFLQMDVVYTFQTSQAAVPGALRRQPSVVSQHNDATAAKTLSSPTHIGLSSSSSLTNSGGALPPAAAASSSTAGSESVTGGQLTARSTRLDSVFFFLCLNVAWLTDTEATALLLL